MSETEVPSLRLNDGGEIPAIGFGTYPLKGAEGVTSIVSAVRAGYRLLDSAFNYENEGALGEAIRRAGVPRANLFVTSKLPGRHHRFENATRTIEESLFRAQLEYYDLYLIHWPNPSRGLYVEAWQALVGARQRGLVRSIGVSNFLPAHIDRLFDETRVMPSVNQVELHPYFPQAEQREFHLRHGIVTQSWSPLARANELLQEPVLTEIAEETGRTVAQVILRWHIQLGALPLPKAASEARQRENLAVFDFELTPEQMAAIGALARSDGRTFDQDPSRYEEL